MNPAKSSTVSSPALSSATSSFALAAAVAVIFNTLLAWTKDAYEPLNSFMKSLTGHHWTTHGLADLVVFIGLGLIFQKARVTERMNADRVISMLVWAALAASAGLGLWYLFF